jgi:hypothetical protein
MIDSPAAEGGGGAGIIHEGPAAKSRSSKRFSAIAFGGGVSPWA